MICRLIHIYFIHTFSDALDLAEGYQPAKALFKNKYREMYYVYSNHYSMYTKSTQGRSQGGATGACAPPFSKKKKKKKNPFFLQGGKFSPLNHP